MKRGITLSIALVLSVILLSLMKSDSTANAQPPQRFRFATGVVTPSSGQTLKVTTAGGTSNEFRVRFAWTQYGAPACSGTPAVCRHMIDSQGATPSMPLGNDALSFDVPGNGNGVNVVVESNSRDVQVNAVVINSLTGEVVAIWLPGNY